MAYRRICAWCGAALDPQSASLEADAPVTHGICPSCVVGMRMERAHSLPDFLERLDGPVMLVDGDGVALEANSRAYAVLGKERPRVAGHRGGEVIDCLYADLPGGCGASEHCRTGCVIRRSVTHTVTTGQPVVRATAEQQVHSPEGNRLKRFLISTEQVAGMVLLRIDDIR
jgi:PAS domain-containing protein